LLPGPPPFGSLGLGASNTRQGVADCSTSASSGGMRAGDVRRSQGCKFGGRLVQRLDGCRRATRRAGMSNVPSVGALRRTGTSTEPYRSPLICGLRAPDHWCGAVNADWGRYHVASAQLDLWTSAYASPPLSADSSNGSSRGGRHQRNRIRKRASRDLHRSP
jgi:hypothetical protein